MNEGDAVDWLAQVHKEGALELEDADEFVQLLWVWFGPPVGGRSSDQSPETSWPAPKDLCLGSPEAGQKTKRLA